GGFHLTLIKDDPQHAILQNVNSFDGGSSSYYNTPISIASGATLVAHWSNGQPLVGTREISAGRVVGLNFFPPSSAGSSGFWGSRTDGAQLMANALTWAGSQGATGVPDDLALTLTSGGMSSAGSNIVYTLQVTNNGPSLATGVVVSNVPPAGTELV